MTCIDYHGSSLYYSRAGNGPTPLLVFHGFGQNHRAFQKWSQPLEKEFTLFAFDLYFHGQSHWPGPNALEKTDWKKILELFLSNEKIENFAVAGFSLGAKFALATLEAFPEKIKKVFLLAPDGIRNSRWYTIATYPLVTRLIFKSMILHPDRFHAIARMFSAVGLLKKSILRFAESQMDTEEKRHRVYSSWVYFRHLTVEVNKIASLVNLHGVPLTVITGKNDTVIPTKNMKPLLRRVEKKQLIVLDCGHQDLIGNAIELLSLNESPVLQHPV